MAIEKDTLYVFISGVKILNMLNEVKKISELNPELNCLSKEDNDLQLKRLREGVFYDIQKFDQAYYGNLNLPLLNNKSDYLPVINNMDTSFNEDKFIKPSRDLKAFEGGILKAGETIGSFIKNQQYQSFYKEEKVVVAECKTIYSEYRFFVVDKKIVGMSQYKLGNKVVINSFVPEYILNKAKEYCKLYQPHDIFTMDLADTKEGIVIVEYNCFNASGFYACDMDYTFNAIENFLLKK